MHTFSLGLGGSITVAFTDNAIVDRPGPDFTVFENAVPAVGRRRPARRSRSRAPSRSAPTASHWVDVPVRARRAAVLPGLRRRLSGVRDRSRSGVRRSCRRRRRSSSSSACRSTASRRRAGSGGDSFDLADVGLAVARFVRIDGGPQKMGLAGLAGFDLDAVAAVHSVDTAGPDADGDGMRRRGRRLSRRRRTRAGRRRRRRRRRRVRRVPVDRGPDAGGSRRRRRRRRVRRLSRDARTRDRPTRTATASATRASPDAPPADTDGDGVPDARDVCPIVADARPARYATATASATPATRVRPSPRREQRDRDGDGAGDPCDPCPTDDVVRSGRARRVGRPGPQALARSACSAT